MKLLQWTIFFINIGLFKDLLSRRIYTCGSLHVNPIGLSSTLKNTCTFKNMEQGMMLWRMHNLKSISCVMWKDKKPMLLLSTHVMSI